MEVFRQVTRIQQVVSSSAEDKHFFSSFVDLSIGDGIFFHPHPKISRGNSYCIYVIGGAYGTLVVQVIQPGCILHKHMIFEDSCPSNFRGWRALLNE